jgi:hypothetical protein
MVGVHLGSPRGREGRHPMLRSRKGARITPVRLRSGHVAQPLQLTEDMSLFRIAVLSTLGLLVACSAPTEDLESEEQGETESALGSRAGTNGQSCKRSPYNCSLHPGGQRVMTPGGRETWGVSSRFLASNQGVPVVDGNGDPLGLSPKTELTFNYGQTRIMNGKRYAYAMSTGLGSSGWVEISAIGASDSFEKAVGNMDAKGDDLKKLGCYELASSYDPSLDAKFVVKGAKIGYAEANDYLPQVRSNGKVYGTLSFNAPGDALGGANTDIFPAGTKFQRVDVPTWESPDLPSLDVKLYSGKGANTPAGTMKFIYGYIRAKSGEVRYGWAALDGLVVSSQCDAR